MSTNNTDQLRTVAQEVFGATDDCKILEVEPSIDHTVRLMYGDRLMYEEIQLEKYVLWESLEVRWIGFARHSKTLVVQREL